MSRVLVTGASGFVGRQLCSDLQYAGWTVRAAVRRSEATGGLPPSIEWCLIPDIGSQTDWTAALADVDAIVHLAGRAHVMREEAADPLLAYRSVNVDGTRTLLSAAVQSGVRRFVFVSSVKAVGEGSPTAYTEATECRPQDAYGRTKLEAEEVVRAAAGLETVILRPPLVYGPGVRANFARLVKLVRRGIPLPLGSVTNARSMIFVRNLNSAIVTALVHPAAAGHLFFVADAESWSTRTLVVRLGELAGRPARLAPVPIPLLRAAARMVGQGDTVERLVGSLTVSTEQIHTVLGWQPPYSLDQGLADTVAWFLGPKGEC